MARNRHQSLAVERLIATGPAPLAQLTRRARNAKTGTAVLQNAAHYLGEAGAALAASYWMGRALASSGGQPNDATRRQLGVILGRGASFGSWVGLWREAAAQVGGDALARLSKPVADIAPIEELIAAIDGVRDDFGDDGEHLSKALKQARKRGVIGFFEFLASFRNKVYGHGTMLSESVCQGLARPFLSAVVHMLGQPCVFEEAWLGRMAVDLLSEQQSRYWLRLSGIAESAVGDHPELPPTEDIAPGALYFVPSKDVSDGPIPLGFWVVQDEDATGLSRFGFLQRALARGRKRAGPDASYKGIEYLDYLGGRFRHDVHVKQLTLDCKSWLGDGERLDASTDESTEAVTGAPQSSGDRRFGDFVIEAELGRGAMGIVYRATQISLDRRVALKVLPPAMLGDPIALGRFHREVQALGRCDHPNVVRVLASGVDEGRPWFAMELVEGADLSEVFGTLANWKGILPLRAGHLSAASSSLSDSRSSSDASGGATEFDAPVALPQVPDPAELQDHGGLYRRLAELFADAADGVAEIHQRGLVHRDLKPANLMLSKDGDRLVVMDLGLAKASDVSVSYTRQSGGDFVGSARYAAPEQLQAKLLAVDHRADIYSLGATLYELTTLHTLYPAEEIAELLQHKLTADPAPARSRDRSIPRDLEIVLQKALARRPEDRYQSAGELARDLRAFAEHRPIRARPPSAFEYLRLFYHRQPRLVHLGLVALTAVLVVVAVSFVLVAGERSRAVAQRDAAEEARDRAQAERDRAESLARFIFDDLYRRLEPLGQLGFLEDVSARMAEHYQSRDVSDPAVAQRQADAIVRMGEVAYRAGHIEEAASHYARARAVINDIRSRHNSDEATLTILASVHSNQAMIDINQNRLADGLVSAKSALEIRQGLVVKRPELQPLKHALAHSHRQVGLVLEKQGDRTQALAAYRQAAEVAETASQAHPEDAIAREELATDLLNMGQSLQALGHEKDAQASFRRALGLLETITRDAPLNMRARRQKATCHDSIAHLLLRERDEEGAMREYRLARDIRTELMALDESRAGWRRDLATSLGNLGAMELRRGNHERAQELYQEALLINRELWKQAPSNMRWRMDIAVTQALLGKVVEQREQADVALAYYRNSLTIAEEVVASDPANTDYQRRLGDYHGMLAQVLEQQGEPAQALTHLSGKRDILSQLVAKDAHNITWQNELASALHKLGGLHLRQKQYQPAIETLSQALGVHARIEKLAPVAPGSQMAGERARTAASIHQQCADAHRTEGRIGDAREHYQTALRLLTERGGPSDDSRALVARLTRLDRSLDARSKVQSKPVETPDMSTWPIQSRSREHYLIE